MRTHRSSRNISYSELDSIIASLFAETAETASQSNARAIHPRAKQGLPKAQVAAHVAKAELGVPKAKMERRQAKAELGVPKAKMERRQLEAEIGVPKAKLERRQLEAELGVPKAKEDMTAAESKAVALSKKAATAAPAVGGSDYIRYCCPVRGGRRGNTERQDPANSIL